MRRPRTHSMTGTGPPPPRYDERPRDDRGPPMPRYDGGGERRHEDIPQARDERGPPMPPQPPADYIGPGGAGGGGYGGDRDHDRRE
jgi:hypothetical protein